MMLRTNISLEVVIFIKLFISFFKKQKTEVSYLLFVICYLYRSLNVYGSSRNTHHSEVIIKGLGL